MIKYLILTSLFLPTLLFSQNRAMSIADLSQDVALMRRELGQLRLEVEQLRRENDSLKNRQSGSVSTDLVTAQNDMLKSEFDAKLQAFKAEITNSVKKDIDSLAKQTNTAIQSIVASLEARPKVALPTTFSSDFPNTGIYYDVQRGDNLSKIATKLGSKVNWIQNANEITDPTSIQVGTKLFIPQK